ncbi:hypothetical protein CXG81DRAFT_25527 [Caulochytrium protostelioides]|uniref:P-loop containing nucleoside triphosphate hydrolase protein n=1 Tax=Caulochytrium protostelioides TaxID=1555241 RepID=A0A4P9X921_9FUNG|nr:hypothetical protein CXG81DRAFT_25527 [Caulochytrium protostelioides]|eukprot:RKP01823.1 hypothetical protein CXG81DRAFT_25527 [Caulochytrium protostelioides]
MTLPETVRRRGAQIQAAILHMVAQQRPQRSPTQPPCWIVGIRGGQGSGKTTCMRHVAAELAHRGIDAIAFSLDDFYLPHAQQQALAGCRPSGAFSDTRNASSSSTTSSDNPLLRTRGQAGTHDVALLTSVLDDLRHGRACRIPRYDKTAYAGEGDRMASEHDQVIAALPCPHQAAVPSRVVLFEGWMVGYRPLVPPALATRAAAMADRLAGTTVAQLADINARLAAYLPLWTMLDAQIWLTPASIEQIRDWRWEAERAQPQGPSLSREACDAFVARFIPGYVLWDEPEYTRASYAAQCRATAQPLLIKGFLLDEHRETLFEYPDAASSLSQTT